MGCARTIAVIICLLAPPSRSQPNSALDELLNRYRGSTERLRTSQIELRQTTTEGDGEQRKTVRLIESRCIRAGEKASCEYRRWTMDPDRGSSARMELQDVSDIGVADGRLLQLQTLIVRQEQTLLVQRPVPEFQYAAWQGPALCGYFPGESGRIDEVLRSAGANVRAVPEVVDGIECDVVDAQTSRARYTVWFARDRGACIVKFTRVQEGEGLDRGTPDVVPPRAARDNEVGKRDSPVRATLTLDAIETKQFGELSIPIDGTLTEEVIYSSGRRTVAKIVVRRTRVELNPDTDRVSFMPMVPDGTPVKFLDGSNSIPHEWRDGKIIPREDKEMVARLRAIVGDRRFTTDAGELSVLELARGPAMFLALVGGIFALLWLRLWARERRRQTSS